MISFNTIPQTITAAVGAILLSATFLSAAVGPVDVNQPHQSSTSAQVQA